MVFVARGRRGEPGGLGGLGGAGDKGETPATAWIQPSAAATNWPGSLRKPQSQVVREAVKSDEAGSGRLSEKERIRVLAALTG